MKWITAGDLEKWTASPTAKPELPGLVADLIRASSPAITAIRFPTGAKGQVRGFDGVLESDVAGLNIPEGKSIWEFGTEKDYRGKAEDDLEKRKDSADADTTFFCVSPLTWDKGKKELQTWESEQTKNYGWKKVIFLDGAKLEDWLAAHDAVGAYHARYTLKIAPQDGARSVEEFWMWYSDRYRPTLTEEVVLCGREDAAKQIINTLAQGPDILTLSADAPDEVIALAVAAIRKQKPEVRYFLEARTIVIDSADAARKLAPNNKLSFLLRGDATRTPGIFSQTGPTINALGRAQKRGHSQRIDRPTAHQMADALSSTMGFDVKDGIQHARACGGSLTVLARQIPNGQYDPPEWVKNTNELLPAIFAGAWDNTRKADCEVMKALSGKEYLDYEATVRPLIHMPDPPIDNEGSVWKVRAPMDAFTECGHFIGREHLERLRPIFTKVFSQIPFRRRGQLYQKAVSR